MFWLLTRHHISSPAQLSAALLPLTSIHPVCLKIMLPFIIPSHKQRECLLLFYLRQGVHLWVYLSPSVASARHFRHLLKMQLKRSSAWTWKTGWGWVYAYQFTRILANHERLCGWINPHQPPSTTLPSSYTLPTHPVTPAWPWRLLLDGYLCFLAFEVPLQVLSSLPTTVALLHVENFHFKPCTSVLPLPPHYPSV